MVARIEYKWYDVDKVYSYNAVINMIVGERGVGKTFGFIARGVRRAIRHGEEFVYMRRTEAEMKEVTATFFDAIVNSGLFPDHEFRTDGKRGEIAPLSTKGEKKRKWQTVVRFVPLSRVQAFKSVNYSRTTMILFDEFIKERGYSRYLPSEFETLLGFYMTVDRSQDRAHIIMLGNSVSIMNPYSTALNLDFDRLPEYSTHQNGFVFVHIANSTEYQRQVRETRLAKFIAGTQFGEYALANQFADAHNELVEKKPGTAVYRYSLETIKGIVSIWRDSDSGLFYVQKKQPKETNVLTMLSERMSESKMLVNESHPLLANLRTAWRSGRVRFDSPTRRNIFSEIFKK